MDAEAKDELDNFCYYKHSDEEQAIYNLALADTLIDSFMARKNQNADEFFAKLFYVAQLTGGLMVIGWYFD